MNRSLLETLNSSSVKFSVFTYMLVIIIIIIIIIEKSITGEH